MVAGYTSVGLVVLAISVCIGAVYGWHLLKGGRSFIEAVRYYAGQHPRATAQAERPTTEMEPLTVEN